MIATWIALGTAYLASSVLSEEIAKKNGRDALFYLCAGLLIGPMAVLMAVTPLPDGHRAHERVANKQIRVIKGQPCPECHRYVGPRADRCPYCRADLTKALWDRPEVLDL